MILKNMFMSNVVLPLATFLIICFGHVTAECTQTSSCSCVFPNGDKYDLTNLKNLDKPIIADGKIENRSFEIQFRPCKEGPIIFLNANNTGSECNDGNGTSACVLIEKVGSELIFNLGYLNETVIKKNDTDEFPIFTLKSIKRSISTFIKIKCCDTPNCLSMKIDNVLGDISFNLTLHAPEGCLVKNSEHKHMSAGSALLIIFFVFTGLYFGCGALILKTIRGATGWEMLPNHAFWCELPLLVRDGIAFTFNCCKPDSYDRI